MMLVALAALWVGALDLAFVILILILDLVNRSPRIPPDGKAMWRAVRWRLLVIGNLVLLVCIAILSNAAVDFTANADLYD